MIEILEWVPEKGKGKRQMWWKRVKIEEKKKREEFESLIIDFF